MTPGWGPGYASLLVVEHIGPSEATVLYAWGHNPWLPDSGWYRQRARVLPNRTLEWTRGEAVFTFQLSKDRKKLHGGYKDDTPETAHVTMTRARFEAPREAQARERSPALEVAAIPALNIIPATGLPATFGRFLGVWEGTWDSGVNSQLVVWAINRASAMVVYAWSDDPGGSFKADFMKRVALVYEEDREIRWGSQPGFTFRLGRDEQTLVGEWENDGRMSTVIMRRVKASAPPPTEAASVP
jgi:hypothetical protein